MPSDIFEARIYVCKYYMDQYGAIVEALQFHTITQSHWSSRSTVCFPSRGSAVHVPGTHKLAMEPVFSSALSRYIGDPDMIDHWPRPRLHAENGKLH